jgi:hypothetical protein
MDSVGAGGDNDLRSSRDADTIEPIGEGSRRSDQGAPGEAASECFVDGDSQGKRGRGGRGGNYA